MPILAAIALAALAAFGPATLPGEPADAPSYDSIFEVPTFGAIDADGDAELTPAEIGAWFASDDPATDAFGVFDTDGDGVVTQREFDALCFEPETGLSI